MLAVGRCLIWLAAAIATFAAECATADEPVGAHLARAGSANTRQLAAFDASLDVSDRELLDDIERGCWLYFWQEVGNPAPLVRDSTADRISSVAGVGFQLASLPIGVEHQWVDLRSAEQRAVDILTALLSSTNNRKSGVFLHYVELDTGGGPTFRDTKQRYEVMASTIDHALLMCGAMVAAEYFGGEVARLTNSLIEQTHWQSFQGGPDQLLSLGWQATTIHGIEADGRQFPWYWTVASDEERLLHFVATGSPIDEHAIDPAKYYQLIRQFEQHGNHEAFAVSWNGSLFTYLFSHCFIDYRRYDRDRPELFDSSATGVDWWHNSQRAVTTHAARCRQRASEYPTLAENRWGLSACLFGDRYLVPEIGPNLNRRDTWYDGVVAPYAAATALPLTPDLSLAALREFRRLQNSDGSPLVWRDPDEGGYGFVDSFSLTPPTAPDLYVAIDQGAMLVAIENARTGLVWRLFMQHPVARRAVDKLKFVEAR